MIRMEQHAEQRKYDPIYPVNQVLNDYFQGTIQDQKYSFFRLFGLLSFHFQKSSEIRIFRAICVSLFNFFEATAPFKTLFSTFLLLSLPSIFYKYS